MTPIIFVLSEMFPKDLFRRKADSLTYRLAGPFDAFRLLVWPVTAVLRGLVAALTRGIPAEERGEALAHLSPGYVLAQTQRREAGSAYQAALSGGAIRLLGREAGSATIPLRKVAMVEADLRGAELRNAVREAGHSWLPVFQSSRANIVGILDVFDCVSGAPDEASAGERARPAPRFHPSESATTVLLAIQSEGGDLALIVDDEGAPIGIVTARDLADGILRELGHIGTGRNGR
jgi:CBS domain containing-hemolysin-like protein